MRAGLPAASVDRRLVGLLSTAAVALAILLSGFVVEEPAPYELYMAGLIGVWVLFGLRISRTVMVPLILLITFNIGGLIATTQMADLNEAPLYMAVSLFLAFTAVFYAAVLETKPGLYDVIFRAWVVAAVGTATLGVIGYFGLLPGTEIFTKYGRAAGAFQDPNVFGPFLTLPGVYLLHRMLTTRPVMMPVYALPLLFVVAGIFLSFSRGAWGLFGVSAVLLVLALFIQSRSTLFRLRLIVMTILAVTLMIVSILAIMQIPGVADLFAKRAMLVQDYDGARLGRFARYGIGFWMATEKPFGIGPLAFGHIFGEDTHNIWLKSLMDYGWLGFGSWLTLVVATAACGFRILFRDRPWQPYLLCAYVVFLGHVGLGSVIDTDHWRHLYLLFGLVWGGIALEARYGRDVAVRNELVRGKHQAASWDVAAPSRSASPVSLLSAWFGGAANLGLAHARSNR